MKVSAMNQTATTSALSLFGLVALSGCAIGYNSTLFVTKSNAGIDIDATPPTAEVSIARREGVIAPSFEGGKSPPVLASFGLNSKFALPFIADVTSTFAGGNAAVAMALLYDEETPAHGTPRRDPSSDLYSSTLKLRTEPKGGLLGKTFKPSIPGQIRPFLFGTDTMLGLKVGWSGQNAQYPDTIKFGLNRKEFALAPVHMINTADGTATPYHVQMPSFLATLDGSASASATSKSGVRQIQYFATGKAAEHLALQQAVRKALVARFDPEAAVLSEQIKVEAAAMQQASAARIDKIMVFVTDAQGNVDINQLNILLPGTGLGATWVSQFAGKPAQKLRKELETSFESSTPAMAANMR